MNIETIWEDFTSGERDLFQRSCRRLLKHTFIVRDKDEDNKRAYYFISKRQEVFSGYLRYIGFDVVIDRENGVIMLRNCADFGENGKIQVNHFQLKKVESLILCCLWTLYADRMRSGGLTRFISVSITDLRFELEKYGIRDQIDRRTMEQTLKLFAGFNLIDINGKIGEEDCMIRLYASLQFALDSEEFRHFTEATQKRMFEKAGGRRMAGTSDEMKAAEYEDEPEEAEEFEEAEDIEATEDVEWEANEKIGAMDDTGDEEDDDAGE